MLLKRDFKEIFMLRDWIYTFEEYLTVEQVRKMWEYDTDDLEGGKLLSELQGSIRLLWDNFAETGRVYPYERLYRFSLSELIVDIEKWLHGDGIGFYAEMSKSEALNELGKLICQTDSERIRKDYTMMFMQVAGFVSGSSINIDASNKTLMMEMDKKSQAALDIVSRFSKD
jgi:hypothetical protein